MKVVYEKQITEILNIKTALTQVNLVEMSTQFLSATSSWLAYLSTCQIYGEPIIQIKAKDVDLIKRKTDLNKYLFSMVPEFFLTNINEFLIFLSRFQDFSIDLIINENSNSFNLDEHDDYELNPILLLIILLMGDSNYVFNPHCRAQFAEC